ncbi:carbohydrate binding [Branchiostoma belcheri]|nr:carbohydrate binding [Branchiostoma belcheri]
MPQVRLGIEPESPALPASYDGFSLHVNRNSGSFVVPSSREVRACPSGYLSHQPSRSCYKAFNQERDYNDAKAICASDGGTPCHAPRCRDQHLFNLKNAVKCCFFRIGLTDIREEGH